MPGTFVITGVSRGIGLELCRQTLAAGHHVLAIARSPEKSTGLQELKREHAGTLKTFALDVTSDTQVAGFLRDLPGAQVVDVLINNAGVFGEDSDFATMSLAVIESTFATNAVAPIRMTKALLPCLQRSAHPKVVHITSQMGSIQDNTGGGHYAYRMSKAALNMFNKSFAVDHPSIVSLVLHPGWVQTDMGGPKAPVTPQASAKGLLDVIGKSTAETSGHFYDFKGRELPW